LHKSEASAELLAEKARFAEEEALLLSRKANDAEAEIQRIRINAIKTEEEKMIMEMKVKEAEMIATRMVEESKRRATEAGELKQELQKARIAEKEAKEKLLEVLSNHKYSPTAHNNFPPASLPPDLIATELRDIHLEVDPMPAVGYDLITNDREMEQLSMEIEKERIEYLEKSKHLQEQLKELKNEIEVLKVDEKTTSMDRIHEDNLLHGENKYSTLRKIRENTTKARVAFFEEL